jgi:hypothetical protein
MQRSCTNGSKTWLALQVDCQEIDIDVLQVDYFPQPLARCQSICEPGCEPNRGVDCEGHQESSWAKQIEGHAEWNIRETVYMTEDMQKVVTYPDGIRPGMAVGSIINN